VTHGFREVPDHSHRVNRILRKMQAPQLRCLCSYVLKHHLQLSNRVPGGNALSQTGATFGVGRVRLAVAQ
jgi:hypothetical protein